MPDTIEAAKSARAACRTCKEPIAKGELRFGEEVQNAFSSDGTPSYQWHHLTCAAKKKPSKLKVALAATTLPVPNQAEIDQLLAENAGKEKPTQLPYAERASTGRAKCMACDQPIEKGGLRVAVLREVDTGSFTTTGPGYLHLACAKAHVNEADLADRVKANSTSLSPAELTEVGQALSA